VALISAGNRANAQYAGPAVSSPVKAASAPDSVANVEYGEVRIVPGDVISIATYGAPELSTAGVAAQGLKVGASGEIVLPYLGPVKLAGLTPSEAAAYLRKALKDGGILVDPQVSVELLDSPTRVITVLGEVQRVALVPAFGQLRLLDVISACGGLTTLASHTIQIHRRGVPDPITVELGVDPKATNVTDIQLMAGDTVVVPRVGSVFIVGQVKNPSALPLSGNAPITVMRALAMAGGVNYSAALSKARIIRTTADNQKVEIMLDLAKVMFGKQQDIALVSDDILYIPTNAFKAIVSSGGIGTAGALVNTAAYSSYILK
jgi:polysaccharide export outer membrane protein